MSAQILTVISRIAGLVKSFSIYNLLVTNFQRGLYDTVYLDLFFFRHVSFNIFVKEGNEESKYIFVLVFTGL